MHSYTRIQQLRDVIFLSLLIAIFIRTFADSKPQILTERQVITLHDTTHINVTKYVPKAVYVPLISIDTIDHYIHDTTLIVNTDTITIPKDRTIYHDTIKGVSFDVALTQVIDGKIDHLQYVINEYNTKDSIIITPKVKGWYAGAILHYNTVSPTLSYNFGMLHAQAGYTYKQGPFVGVSWRIK